MAREGDSMAVDVTSSIEIACPRHVVSEYAANPSNVPEWYVNIESIEWQGAPGVRVGAQARFFAHFLGRRMAYTYEIAEYTPGERLVMRTSEGPFPMETTYEWRDAAGGGTHMTLRNRGEPSGFSGLASFIMVPAMRRANRKDLALLKEVLEQRG